MAGDSLLWAPFGLRGIELRNRFVMLAHWNGLEGPDGTPTEDLAAYYEARARGGVGLIVAGSYAMHPSGQMSPNYGRAWDRDAIPAYRRIVEAVQHLASEAERLQVDVRLGVAATTDAMGRELDARLAAAG